MLKLLFITSLIGLTLCDVSSGPYPYPASNYRPSPASLALPGEYGAPPLPSNQYGAPPSSSSSSSSSSSVQVTRENIQFGGQIVEVSTARPNNAFHFVPSRVQFQQLKKPQKPNNEAFLPKPNPPKPFRGQLNTGEVFVISKQSAQFRNPIFVEAKAVFNSKQQLPQFQQIRQFNSGASQRQQVPATQYGVPQQTYPYPPSPPVHEITDDEQANDDEPEDTTDPTIVTISNAANGQYYLLGKDNTLQRVVYKTIQTEDDAANNGFTAQLRYSPVEPIRDPVYGYDDEGHLVRIFNKK